MSGGVDPATAWAAASAAVALVLGEGPPPGRVRPGRALEKARMWRRKLAVYTAVTGLGVGGRPIAPHTGVGRRMVRLILTEVEDLRDQPAIDELLDVLSREARRQLDAAA